MAKSKARWCSQKTQNLIILYYLGLTSQELSQVFHTSPGALQKRLDRLCVKPNSIMHRFGYHPKEDSLEIQRQLPVSISIQDMEYTLQKCKQCLEITESMDHEILVKCLMTHFPLAHKKKRSRGNNSITTNNDDKNSCAEQWKSMKEICLFVTKINSA